MIYTHNYQQASKQGFLSDFWDEQQYLSPGKFWHRLPQPFRLAFVSAFFLGLVVHLYVFSNLLLNHDSVRRISCTNDVLTLGRWSLGFFSSLSGIYQMPVVIGVLTLLALAVCAGLTVCILDISSPVCVFLVSGFLVSFPSVASIFAYMYTADAYFIAALLHVVAVYITKKFHFGWFAATLCITVSLGIYQAFIGCSVTLFLLDCILAIFSGASAKDTLKRGTVYVAVILAGLVLYRVILAYLLWKNHAVLSSYKSVDEAINSGVLDYLRAVPGTYHQILGFFWSADYLAPPLRLLQRIMFFFAAGCFAALTALKKVYKDPLRLLLLFCCAALLPMALNLICVICAGLTNVHMLMQYSYVFAYVFALKLFEMTALEIRSLRFEQVKHTVVLTCLAACAALVWANVCVCNTAYLAQKLTMEYIQATGVRVLSRLETLEDYVPGETPVLLTEGTKTVEKVGIEFPRLTWLTGLANSRMLNDQFGAASLQYFCGAGDFLRASEEQNAAIKDSGVLDTMPTFPAKDSIQFYNGVVIVKFG